MMALCLSNSLISSQVIGGEPTGPVRTVFTGRNQFPIDAGGHATERVVTYRKRLPVYNEVFDLQAVFYNGYIPSTQEVAMPDTISVSCRVSIGGVNSRFTWGGPVVGSMAPGAVLVSDIMAVGVNPAVNSFIYVDSYASNPTPTDVTKMWPTNYTLYNEFGDGMIYGQNYTTVGAPAPPTVALGSQLRGFSPVMLIGNQLRGNPFVLIIGDSIATGQGDVNGINQTTVFSNNDQGFIKRALDAQGIAYLSLSKPGDKLSEWNTSGNRTVSKSLFSYGFNSLISEYGVNDIAALTSGATMISMSNTMFADARSRGISDLYQTTVTTKTSSADFYRTFAGQTISAGFTSGGAKDVFNAWIVGGSAGQTTAYFDMSVIESSGKWLEAPTLYSGTVASATSTAITVSGTPWTAAQWQDCYLIITGGTGFPQTGGNVPRAIRINTTNTLTCIPGQGFVPALGAGTTFEIFKPVTVDGLHPSSHGHALMSVPVVIP